MEWVLGRSFQPCAYHPHMVTPGLLSCSSTRYYTYLLDKTLFLQVEKLTTIFTRRYKIPLVPNRDTTSKTGIADFDKNISMVWRELHTLLINCGVELSLTFLFLQWKKRGLEGEEDSLEEISRGRKGENLGQILVLAAQLQRLCRKSV